MVFELLVFRIRVWDSRPQSLRYERVLDVCLVFLVVVLQFVVVVLTLFVPSVLACILTDVTVISVNCF